MLAQFYVACRHVVSSKCEGRFARSEIGRLCQFKAALELTSVRPPHVREFKPGPMGSKGLGQLAFDEGFAF